MPKGKGLLSEELIRWTLKMNDEVIQYYFILFFFFIKSVYEKKKQA